MRGHRLQNRHTTPQAISGVSNDATARPVIKTIASKQQLLLIAAVMIALAVVIGLIVRTSIKTEKTSPVADVSLAVKPLLEEAKTFIEASNTGKLAGIVAKVQVTKGYDTNQDALYVVVVYYIKTGDPVLARSNLNKLLAVYSGKSGFSKSLGNAKPVTQLESDVIFLETQSKQLQDSSSRGLPLQ